MAALHFGDEIVLPDYGGDGRVHAPGEWTTDSVRVQIERQRSDPAILDILDALMAEHAALERESIEIA